MGLVGVGSRRARGSTETGSSRTWPIVTDLVRQFNTKPTKPKQWPAVEEVPLVQGGRSKAAQPPVAAGKCKSDGPRNPSPGPPGPPPGEPPKGFSQRPAPPPPRTSTAASTLEAELTLQRAKKQEIIEKARPCARPRASPFDVTPATVASAAPPTQSPQPVILFPPWTTAGDVARAAASAPIPKQQLQAATTYKSSPPLCWQGASPTSAAASCSAFVSSDSSAGDAPHRKPTASSAAFASSDRSGGDDAQRSTTAAASSDVPKKKGPDHMKASGVFAVAFEEELQQRLTSGAGEVKYALRKAGQRRTLVQGVLCFFE